MGIDFMERPDLIQRLAHRIVSVGWVYDLVQRHGGCEVSRRRLSRYLARTAVVGAWLCLLPSGTFGWIITRGSCTDSERNTRWI